MGETRDFSWTLDRDDVVLPEQPETACYLNSNNFIVIRQNGWPDDDDSVVVIDPHNVPLLVAVMLEKAKEADGGQLRLPPPAPRSEAKPYARQPEPQGRASDTPSMAHAKDGGNATGDLLAAGNGVK